MSNKEQISSEIDAATRALDSMIATHLEAGADRCVLAATCIWGGVKEMSEIVSPESVAAALRAIADQFEPPAGSRRPLLAVTLDDAVATTREHTDAAPAPRPDGVEATHPVAVNQAIVRDIVGDAVELLDQDRPTEARALLLAFLARLFPRRRHGRFTH